MKKALLALCALCSAWASAPASAPPTLDVYVREQMRQKHIPGLALAVLRDGKVVALRGYGSANLETGTPVTPATAFRIASLSKQFIATAILLLQQDGKLTLEDPAVRYLDGAPATWSGITIRQLLSHTAGLVRDPTDYRPYVEQPITDVITASYALPLNAPPGEKFLYSNIGYYVLAAVITRASGEPWDRFIAERLFGPAGLKHTRMGELRPIVPARAAGYQQIDDTLVNAENWLAVRPSSAFLSTVEDLAAWDRFVDSRDPLSPANRALMRTPARLADGTATNYGTGWYLDSYLGRSRMHHDGQYPGFRADYERFEEDRLTVIVLANADMADLQSLAVTIAGRFADRLAPPPFTLKVSVPAPTVPDSTPVAIRIVARSDTKAAPNTLLEMEIWDAAGETVYKQRQSGEDFAAGETREFTFHWTPERAGTYSVNVGAYGPRWTPSYAWSEGAARLEVK